MTRRMWGLMGLLCCTLAQADGLQDQVREVIAPRLPARAQMVAVDIGQPAARIAACAHPRPYLVRPEQSVLGRVAVGVRCLDEVAGYLQVSVRVVGDYVVSRQRIAAGEVIKAPMLELKRGPLERLPKGSVFEPSQIIGRQASRNLSRGMVITVNHVRERWLVERNARVVLQAQGAGFSISREGKALDNGGLGSTVRVVGNDGKMLNAQVVGQNELLLRY
ncbi:flagella basal body P-ring formation protein FlgA [Pseudomonas marginalis]|uniref:flagellar basal body P-ring formation chaperone FlgA n=1 Tax=Pseudomonas marginalis TaxID=298 RepID=UPI0020A1CC0F|nr:flagellar basal body P-ring formation chaperone FlgA [Pseudomonas marginalis]MCP1508703.1 flagella basal body P-ring formation protein FlgA [Pseudomonas marginalis]MCP1526208.1 flagella basal body P-ring formation protein FlgA [Pseudomonas marginalis]MDQ0498479.1 flagella basal body P-ring formation protein FlgA [Pseudomonas marginalis]